MGVRKTINQVAKQNSVFLNGQVMTKLKKKIQRKAVNFSTKETKKRVDKKTLATNSGRTE